MAVEVTSDAARLPGVAEVERLYAAASAAPPLNEAPRVARSFAGLYGWACGNRAVTAVMTRDEHGLAGFGYGYPFSWAADRDEWSTQLRARLGDMSADIDESFSVLLLAVRPDTQGQGVGRRILDELVAVAAGRPAWLQTTDIDSPARRLYATAGWVPLGHGPDAPDGRPGLVLVRR